MAASRDPRARSAPPTGDEANHTASPLLTADELAERWSVSTDHVYRLAREGKLPTTRLGRYRRWRFDQVEEFERAGGTTDG